MQVSIIKSFVSLNGGTNNCPVVMVVSGFLTLAAFHGKTASRRATTWVNKWNKGLTPNN